MLDLPGGGDSVRIALPSEARPVFRAHPIVDDESGGGPDWSISATGIPDGSGEVWFDFDSDH